MDMAFDLDGTGSGRPSGVHATLGHHPTWPDLLARLVAARETSASLGREDRTNVTIERGSFDEGAAAFVAAHAALRRSVNPNDLGNSKPGGAISSPVAGLTRTGGRG